LDVYTYQTDGWQLAVLRFEVEDQVLQFEYYGWIDYGSGAFGPSSVTFYGELSPFRLFTFYLVDFDLIFFLI